jgi:signal transduction histidine kinase
MKITSEILSQSWRSWFSNDMRRVGPEWLQLVWTLLFAACVALVFTLFGVISNGGQDWANPHLWWRWYRVNFVISLAVALTVHGLFAVLIPWIKPERIRRFGKRQRAVFFTAIPMLGVCLGWPVGVWLVSDHVVGWVSLSLNATVASAAIALLISGIFFLFFNSMANKVEAEKRATEAQLRLLQAQIEPHFLFNTLANVQSLMDHDVPKAKQMLASFTDYLRASLTTLRSDSSPVAQELALAQCYLELLQARMEDRLQFSISADEATRALPLPPLLLQPLVENAVVHGLEPSIDGGTVFVSARRQGTQLVLEVQDNGMGLDAPARPGRRSAAGHGMALANIRQRLLTRYGSAATLEVSATHPGTLARITLPLENA